MINLEKVYIDLQEPIIERNKIRLKRMTLIYKLYQELYILTMGIELGLVAAITIDI